MKRKRGHFGAGLVAISFAGALSFETPLLASCGQANQSGEPEMTRDEAFRSVLAKLRAFEQAWSEDPKNLAALEGASNDLRTAVSTLRSAKTEGEARGNTKTAPPPQGPFRPSSESSSESEQEKRRAATEDRFLSGGPLGKETESESLHGVPEEWIVSSCDRARSELTALDGLAKKTPLDERAFQEALETVARSIRGMAHPPER